MNIAIIAGGGNGTRMGLTDQPKQFLEIYGKPIIIHTIEVFDRHEDINAVCVVVPPNWRDELRIWLRRFNVEKVQWIADAGATRQESVYNGLLAIHDSVSPNDVIVVHDAARPLLSYRIISENIAHANSCGAVDTAIPSADTIVRSIDQKTIESIPTRSELLVGQTPQSFRFSLLWDAHKQALQQRFTDTTDDCKLLLHSGYPVHIVQGDKLNFKITTMDDLLLLRAIIKLGKSETL